MPKLTREQHRSFLDSNFGTGTPKWQWLGDDTDDMSVELNPDVSTSKNVKGQTSVDDNGYEPTLSVDTYKANTDDPIYPHIRDIAMNLKKGDDCKTTYMDVIIEDTDEENHPAWTQSVIVKPTSYGGDTAGFGIPFDVYFEGARTKGYVKIVDYVPTFTAGEIPD